MLIVIGKQSFTKQLQALWEDARAHVQEELRGIKSVTDLAAKVKSLKQSVETLEIEKARKTEEYERKEREIEHKVGLERERQKVEIENAKREASVMVREENLAADRQRFADQMKFQEERFTKEVGYLKEMLADIVKRLPSAEFTADLSSRRGRK